MSGRITVEGARYFQRLAFGNAADPLPEFWVALISNSSPTVFMTADEMDEVDGVNYERVSVSNDPGHWTDSPTGARTNVDDIIFPEAGDDWGQIKHWAVTTTRDSGLVLFFGTLTTPVDVYALDRLVIPSGAISLGINILYQGE